MSVVAVSGQVGFGECDPLGIMWHGHYWRWLEIARTELLRSVGLDVPDLAAFGVRVVVADARCSHHRPLRYAERFRVEAWVPLAGPGVDVQYRVTSGAEPGGPLCAKARTLLAAIHPTEDRLIDVPAALLARLEPIVGPRSADP